MAEFFKWDPSTLSVHVKEMDNEHIQLIQKMNALHESYTSKADSTKQAALLNDFVNYTLKHFQDEEAYMEKIKFEGLETHKIIHKQLVAEVQKYAQEFESKKVFSEAFFKFLTVWLSSHIRGIDSKYGKN